MVINSKKYFIYSWNYVNETIFSRDTIFHHIVAWYYLFTSEILDKGQVWRINNWDLVTEKYGVSSTHGDVKV